MTVVLERLEIVLPMPVSFSNASGRSRHWRTIAREKKQYYASCDTLQLVGRIPRPPVTPIGAAVLTVTMHLGARMDVDNAVARCKWPIDWLATRGYLENDRLLEWTGMPHQVVKRGAEYRLELVITPATSSPPR